MYPANIGRKAGSIILVKATHMYWNRAWPRSAHIDSGFVCLAGDTYFGLLVSPSPSVFLTLSSLHPLLSYYPQPVYYIIKDWDGSSYESRKIRKKYI